MQQKCNHSHVLTGILEGVQCRKAYSICPNCKHIVAEMELGKSPLTVAATKRPEEVNLQVNFV